MPGTCLHTFVTLTPQLLPRFAEAMNRLRLANPKATDPQLVDLIFERGITAVIGLAPATEEHY